MTSVILQGLEYDEIEEAVVSLFEDLRCTEFPVDVFELAGKLKIDVQKYSEVPPEDREMLVSKYEDGYSTCLGKYRYKIYYNDLLKEERIRFTLWYEIGHIQLGHFDNCHKTQEVMKAEANHFAVHAQAPMAAIIEYQPSDEYDLAEAFNLSFECASNRFASYLRVICYASTIERILDTRLFDVLTFPILEKRKEMVKCR